MTQLKDSEKSARLADREKEKAEIAMQEAASAPWDETDSPMIIRDGRNVFLREELLEEKPPGYAVKMINLNQPERLLRMHFIREAHHQYADYNISGLVSLTDAASDSVLNYLYAVISALEEAERELSELLLSVDDLSLDPRKIYLRAETGQVYFCYLPDKAGCFQEAVSGLMEYFVKTANPVEEEEILLLYGLYRKSREAQVTPAVLSAFLKDRRKTEGPAEDAGYFASSIEEGRLGKSFVRESARSAYPDKGPVKALKMRGQGMEQGAEPGEDEREIYEELGLETEDRDAAFHAWQRIPKLAEDPTEKRFEPTLEEELAHAVIKPEKGKGILGKIKAHLLELSVGTVVLVVSLVVLLT